MATTAVIAAVVTLVVFALVGKYIFMLFNITIPAFHIASGILLFRVALEREMVGVIPLGIPMLAGPRRDFYRHALHVAGRPA